MNYKKIILVTVLAWASSPLAEGVLSFPLLYPVKNPKQFNETSQFISGLQYSWTVSSYFPEHVRELVGQWHLQADVKWLHTIPRRQNTQKKDTTKIKTFISYYPAIISAGVRWELDHLHYIRPFLGAGYALNNPLSNLTLLQNSFLDKKLSYLTAGLFFSFDIIDSNFSHRMNYEYNIRDMGLFVEYQKYHSLAQKSQSHWGVNIGLFLAL